MRVALIVTALIVPVASLAAQDLNGWPQHSTSRPQPKLVTPGASTAPVPPPSDAIILFDGKSLASWRHGSGEGTPAKWKVADGYMEVVASTGGITSVQRFGDVHLHVEWATAPNPRDSVKGQARSNSGVFLMGRYEVQILDSYNNTTYPDGQAGSVYGQYPPLVNASRKPGEWQKFDIIFHAPRFKDDSSVASPARLTVFHNGVLVQDNVSLVGPTSNGRRDPYVKHADSLPISLQDHGDPVRFRNIWARPLTP